MRIKDFPVVNQIKNDYTKLRQDGINRDKAVAKLTSSYIREIDIGAEDDGLLFWIGLADAQYALKELSEECARQGITALKQIEQTDRKITPSDLCRRREWYAKAPMPERKQVNKPKRFRCDWKIGDTFAYQLLGTDAEEFGLENRYVLFRKVSEVKSGNGCIVPIVTVSMWDDMPLPTSSDEFVRVPFLKLNHWRAHSPAGLFIYRTEMLIDNKRSLDKLNLQFLGNFSDVTMPKDEFVIDYVGYMDKLALNRINISCCYYWRNHQIYERMT